MKYPSLMAILMSVLCVTCSAYADSIQSGYAGGSDVFVPRLSPNGDSLPFAAHFGGAGNDYAAGLTISSSGDIIVCGVSNSPDLAVVDPLYASPAGANDMFLLAISPGQNRAWYVSTDGSNETGDGSYDTPFASIQHAIDIAADGDTVIAKSGVYNEHINVVNREINVISENGRDFTTITSDTSRCMSIYASSSVNLLGFTFDGLNQSGANIQGGGIYAESSRVSIVSCTIQGCKVANSGGGIYTTATSIILDSCIISDNNVYCYYVNGGPPIYGGGAILFGDSAQILNSEFRGNTCGIENTGGGGLAIFGNYFQIQNCVFAGNSAEAVYSTIPTGYDSRGGGLYIIGDSGSVNNCRFSNNTAESITRHNGARTYGGAIYLNGEGTSLSYNVIDGNISHAKFWDGGDNSTCIATGGGIYINGENTIGNNTIVNNISYAEGWEENYYCYMLIASSAGGVFADGGIFEDNIVAYNSVETAVNHVEGCNPGCDTCIVDMEQSGSGAILMSGYDDCNVFYGNIGADELGGEFSGELINADPQFCDTVNSDFKVSPYSPCAADNNSCNFLIGAEEVGCSYLPGDAGGDSTVDIGDAVYLINYIFKGGPAPSPLNAGDPNADCAINIGDAIYLIIFTFRGGPEPQLGCVE